ncbi:MAG: M23 family metallopeptidase [Solirubrobacterales bacterium]|nr:M23 family metallopeptidase [Solirubrobacterales bacterium]
MLNRCAQPTSRPRLLPEGAFGLRLSAACGGLLATIAILLTLTTPNGAATADGGGGAWPWPLLGDVITPYKNGSDRFAAGQHRGLDIAAPAGTQVRAIVDGRVTFAGALPDGGVTVTVRSSDGAQLVSGLHLASRAVSRGESVAVGQVIGTVGTTGKRSIVQPHLHLSVRRASDRAYLDPMTLLGAQQLPKSAPIATAPPAAAQTVAPAKQSRRPKVRVTPLESRLTPNSRVHAHALGDSSPAQMYGASSRPTTAGSSAGAPAREGHAAQHVSRVAPPPLKDQEPARVKVASGKSDPAMVQTPTPVAASATGNGPNRLLLFAVAAVCLIALAMRRKSTPLPSRDEPPVSTSAPVEREAEVIPLHRAS